MTDLPTTITAGNPTCDTADRGGINAATNTLAFPAGTVASIMKAIGHAGYVWNLETDNLDWTDNFTNLAGLKSDEGLNSGRAFESLLSTESPGTRFGVVHSAASRANPDGVDYQCVYSILASKTLSGEPLWIEDTGKWYPGPDGKPLRAEGMIRIINERRKREERLKHRSDFDDLTELPNRRCMETTIENVARQSFEDDASAAFLLLSINRMELINETYGFDVGDEVIREVGRIVKSKLRGDDMIARFSGAKFGIILNNCSSSEVFIAAKRFLTAMEDDVFQSKAGPVAMSGSIGSCLLPRHASTAGEAIEASMRALKAGKEDGTLRVGVYSPNPIAEENRKRQADTVTHVVNAVQNGKLRLAFQPVVDARSHKILFHEALLRIEDDQGRTGAGAGFVAVAEKLGLIRIVDHKALELTLDTLMKYPAARLSLNVSLKTAEDPDWLSVLAFRLAQMPDVAKRLIIEITESHAASDLDEAIRFVEMVKGLGCAVAIDDFGAGYTSFSNLRHLKVDWIKVDGAFCNDLKNDLPNQVFIQSLVKLAKVHGAQTVVEWVENHETAAMLAEWGTDALQGHVFGQPLMVYPWEKGPEPVEGDNHQADVTNTPRATG